MSLDFCSPDEVPAEIKCYDKKIPQMDVGKAGKIGYLLKYHHKKGNTINIFLELPEAVLI